MHSSEKRHVAVIDIGKTNAKILLIDLRNGVETVVAKISNSVVQGPPYPHFDTVALFRFVVDGLREVGKRSKVDAISITTHGACAAMTDAAGNLVLPVLDYEYDGPDEHKDEYDQVRPSFKETGSPRLPGGLNLGAQIYWLSKRFPEAFARTKHILTWPQYWAMKLSGVAASELTSLGCHTDLWDPWNARFSPLVENQGWRSLFPQIQRTNAALGNLKTEIAAQTGLDANTPVHCGIHDSNASLLPYLDGKMKQFAVMSTGTWMITLSVGGKAVQLSAERDALANVNAYGEATPTARFMAGREFDQITQGQIVQPEDQDCASVLERQILALPSLNSSTGPFPNQEFAWVGGEPGSEGERTCAASYYCALMGAECLDLIGALGPIYVEGAFGGNREFLSMLATATGRPVIANGQTAGTGLGAAVLVGPIRARTDQAEPVLPSQDPALIAYAQAWRKTVQARAKRTV